ncbi:ABC transporter substrate-binding protein [Aeromicrobium sp. P5_D10]
MLIPKFTSRIGAVALAATVVLTLSACGGSSDDAGSKREMPAANAELKGEIHLGAVLPLTGVNATIGKDQKRGIDLAVATINSKAGVLGKKLVVDVEDSEGRAPAAIQAARKLVDVSKVPVIIGEYSSGNSIPMQQYLQKQGIVGLNPGSSSIDMRPLGDKQFSVIGLDDVAGAFTADALNESGHKSIAVLAPNNAYGSGIVASVADAFGKLGGKVVGKELYTEGQADYRQELNRLKDLKPDAYVITTYGKDGATINKEVFELGISKDPVFDIYLSQDVPDADPVAVEGRTGMDVNAIADAPESIAYRDAYKLAFGEDFVSSFNGLAYDAVLIAAAAINEAGAATSEAIAKALPTVSQTFTGVTGPILFDADGQRSKQPYVLATVKDGEIVPQ